MNKDKNMVEQKLLNVLEKAILEEQASTARYKHGASIALEGEVREMFEKLAEDELEHERLLKKQYYEIKKRLGLKVMKED